MWLRRGLIGALVAAVAIWAIFLTRRGVHKAVFHQVCSLVGDNFYRDDQQLREWLELCQKRSGAISIGWGRSEFLRQMQWLLDDLQVSHLTIFDPVEDRRLWHGEAVDTGLRARAIENHWVVARVLSESIAAELDLRVGDEVLALEGEPIHSAWQVEAGSGRFSLRRGEKKLDVFIEARPLVIDRRPTLTDLKANAAQLEISSFRSEYFAAEAWRQLMSEAGRFSRVIVDLRDNSGGNLVAMLRALSPFLCTVTNVGSLSQPRQSKPLGVAPLDDLDDFAQLAQFDSFQSVPLKTFGTYGCFNGQVTVLINQGTASVAEIFAQAMRVRPETRVWGSPSAGDVLLATWYGLPLLGHGYSMSIPESVFLTTTGESLEGGGVWPDKELRYDLAESLNGKDSWVYRALEVPGN